MELKLENSFKEFIAEIECYLCNKKNFMMYDDFRDDQGREAYRFFYSSSKDYLEFIKFDLFISTKKNMPFGIISILTSVNNNNNFTSIYGEVVSENKMIRSTEKTNIDLLLNKNGYDNIIAALKYFEDKLI